MRRMLALASLCLVAVGLAGCTICASPYDCDYGFYGGTWERHDPSQGRVGSAFNNAGGPVNVTQEEPIQTPGEPTPTDSPERPTTPTPLRPDVEGEASSPPPSRAVPTSAGRMKAKRSNAAWSGGFSGGRMASASQ